MNAEQFVGLFTNQDFKNMIERLLRQQQVLKRSVEWKPEEGEYGHDLIDYQGVLIQDAKELEDCLVEIGEYVVQIIQHEEFAEISGTPPTDAEELNLFDSHF